ncbi:hypothetical protein PBI_SHEAKEIRA_55 [Mycobacterium phage SheaKeira]|nr:hypothetical protein PBI_SHEAKEIRA_55 [Mycobacterium phage SheaKeira]
MSESILEEAQRLIHGERNKNYGHPRDNFSDIAALFSGYLERPISDIDVANLMILVKVARVKDAGYHRDSFTDIAGYAGCVERIYEEPIIPEEQWEGAVAQPRVWEHKEDVPHGVKVLSAGNAVWRRYEEHGGDLLWGSDPRWKVNYDKISTGPFTEILDDE